MRLCVGAARYGGIRRLSTVSANAEAARRCVHRRESGKVPPVLDAVEAVAKVVTSGARVFVHGAAATPSVLLHALADVAVTKDLQGVETWHLHFEGKVPHLDASRTDLAGRIRDRSFFVGANARAAVNEGRADFTPMFLSEIPLFFRRGKPKLDVAFVTVSPADKHGFHR